MDHLNWVFESNNSLVRSPWREILVSLCYFSHCWENVFKPILCVQCDFIIINLAVICTAYESDVYPWFLADSDGFGTIEQPLEIIKSIGRSFTQTKPNPSVVLMRVMFILDSFMQTWKVANGMAWRTAKQLHRVKSAALYYEFQCRPPEELLLFVAVVAPHERQAHQKREAEFLLIKEMKFSHRIRL